MKFNTERFPGSPRLAFRKPEPSDAPFYLQLMSDPDYIRFIADRGITTLEAACTFIEKNTLPSFEKNGGVGLWLVEEKSSGDPAGICGLVVRDGLEMPDLGYAFLDKFRGKGYAREAAEAVLLFSGAELGLGQICAITHPANSRSAELLLKTGFRASGQRDLPQIDGISDYYVADL